MYVKSLVIKIINLPLVLIKYKKNIKYEKI